MGVGMGRSGKELFRGVLLAVLFYQGTGPEEIRRREAGRKREGSLWRLPEAVNTQT
jgi:hypothetical protein